METSKNVRAEVAGWTSDGEYIVDSFKFALSDDYLSSSDDDKRTAIIEEWAGINSAIDCIDSAVIEELDND